MTQPHISDGAEAPRMAYKEVAAQANAKDVEAPPRNSLAHISHIRLVGVPAGVRGHRRGGGGHGDGGDGEKDEVAGDHAAELLRN